MSSSKVCSFAYSIPMISLSMRDLSIELVSIVHFVANSNPHILFESMGPNKGYTSDKNFISDILPD